MIWDIVEQMKVLYSPFDVKNAMISELPWPLRFDGLMSASLLIYTNNYSVLSYAKIYAYTPASRGNVFWTYNN